MMLLKCCTQYASKFGKLSTVHRTGKGQFSFQSQRKAMLKNVQATTQLYSSRKLANQYSKFSKWGFNFTQTGNFQMFKLDSENVEEPEIKLPTSFGSLKMQENSGKASTSASLIMPKTLLCGSQQILRDGNFRSPLLPPEKPGAGQEATEPHMEKPTGSELGKEYIKAVYCHPAYLTSMQSTSHEMPAGWSTSWNQVSREKYK